MLQHRKEQSEHLGKEPFLISPEQISARWPAHDHIIPTKHIPGKALSTLGVLDLFLESDRVILPCGVLGSNGDLKEICQQKKLGVTTASICH